MLKQYKIADEKIIESQETGASVLVYIKPSDEEKKHLIEHYAIDEHTLASALDPDEISRLEFESNHTALIFKIPKNYSGKRQLVFKCSTMGVFLFKDILLVVMPEDLNLFDGKQFVKVNNKHDVILKLLYRAIYHFLEHLRIFNMIADDLENKINTSMENRYLINLFTLEKSVVYYLNAINSNGVLIEKLKHSYSKISFVQEQMELLDDLLIENNQCYKQAEISSNIFASLMDARASIVSNNLNILMKKLNIITIAIMVPTFVVSAFSMNVRIPLSGLDFAFWVVIALAVISVVIFMLLWKNKKI